MSSVTDFVGKLTLAEGTATNADAKRILGAYKAHVTAKNGAADTQKFDAFIAAELAKITDANAKKAAEDELNKLKDANKLNGTFKDNQFTADGEGSFFDGIGGFLGRNGGLLACLLGGLLLGGTGILGGLPLIGGLFEGNGILGGLLLGGVILAAGSSFAPEIFCPKGSWLDQGLTAVGISPHPAVTTSQNQNLTPEQIAAKRQQGAKDLAEGKIGAVATNPPQLTEGADATIIASSQTDPTMTQVMKGKYASGKIVISEVTTMNPDGTVNAPKQIDPFEIPAAGIVGGDGKVNAEALKTNLSAGMLVQIAQKPAKESVPGPTAQQKITIGQAAIQAGQADLAVPTGTASPVITIVATPKAPAPAGAKQTMQGAINTTDGKFYITQVTTMDPDAGNSAGKENKRTIAPIEVPGVVEGGVVNQTKLLEAMKAPALLKSAAEAPKLAGGGPLPPIPPGLDPVAAAKAAFAAGGVAKDGPVNVNTRAAAGGVPEHDEVSFVLKATGVSDKYRVRLTGDIQPNGSMKVTKTEQSVDGGLTFAVVAAPVGAAAPGVSIPDLGNNSRFDPFKLDNPNKVKAIAVDVNNKVLKLPAGGGTGSLPAPGPGGPGTGGPGI